MADRPDKRMRRAAVGQWKAQEQAAARAKLPLSVGQMRALFDALDAELPCHGCDHTLRLVRGWCDRQRLPLGPVEAWLLDNGGCCDCEALANAEQAFQEVVNEPGG